MLSKAYIAYTIAYIYIYITKNMCSSSFHLFLLCPRAMKIFASSLRFLRSSHFSSTASRLREAELRRSARRYGLKERYLKVISFLLLLVRHLFLLARHLFLVASLQDQKKLQIKEIMVFSVFYFWMQKSESSNLWP